MEAELALVQELPAGRLQLEQRAIKVQQMLLKGPAQMRQKMNVETKSVLN